MATNNQASQLANQALAPVLAEIKRKQDEERRRAAQAQSTARNTASGLAQVLGGIAPNTQAAYQQAGDSTAAYAKGFSAAFANDSKAAAAGLNEIIAKTGAGGQVQAAGDAGGDVLYGVGGYIPAAGLAREGAAFTAAAQGLPATAQLQGHAQAGAIGRESLSKLSQLDALLRNEKAKLPGLTMDALMKMREDARAEKALQIQADYLGLSETKTNAELTGTYVGADGKVYPTAEASEASSAAASKAKTAKQKAIAKRNDATVDAIMKGTEWVEKQLKPGTQKVAAGEVPIISRRVKVGKETVIYYVKEGGGETRSVDEAAKKTVYNQQALPKKQYNKLLSQLHSRLLSQLRRFGYKPAQIRAMAVDILDDYFTFAEQFPPTPNLPDQDDSTTTRGGR